MLYIPVSYLYSLESKQNEIVQRSTNYTNIVKTEKFLTYSSYPRGLAKFICCMILF